MATVTGENIDHVHYTARAWLGRTGTRRGTDGLLGEAAHYGGENPPVAGQQAAPLRELMDDRLLDALLERSRDETSGLRLREGSMLGELVKAVLERALEAELTAHLGYERHDLAGRGSGNSRNGTFAKKVQTGPLWGGVEVGGDRVGVRLGGPVRRHLLVGLAAE